MKFVLVLLLFLVLFGQASGQNIQPTKIRVNNVELHYIERGQGEPLILLHGGTGDFRSWRSQMETFSKNYRVISYSRRYHYPNQNSLTKQNYSALIEAEDLAAFLRELKLKRVHLVGQSYGAFTALAFAVKHPKMVRTLVLAEPPVHQVVRDLPEGEAAYQDFMNSIGQPAAEAFKKGEDREAMGIFTSGIFGRKLDDFPPAIIGAVMQNAQAIKAIALSSDPFPKISREQIKRIKIPVLILTGENTIKIHKLVNQELSRILPNAENVTIPKSGHGTPLENPQAFNEAVLRFLADATNTKADINKSS